MVVAQKKEPTRRVSDRKAAKKANAVSNSQCFIYSFVLFSFLMVHYIIHITT